MNADGMFHAGHELLGNNLYAYCGNNPVNNIDPDGQFVITLSLAALATIFVKAVVITTVVAVTTVAIVGTAYLISNAVSSGNVASNNTLQIKIQLQTETKQKITIL